MSTVRISSDETWSCAIIRDTLIANGFRKSSIVMDVIEDPRFVEEHRGVVYVTYNTDDQAQDIVRAMSKACPGVVILHDVQDVPEAMNVIDNRSKPAVHGVVKWEEKGIVYVLWADGLDGEYPKAELRRKKNTFYFRKKSKKTKSKTGQRTNTGNDVWDFI